MKKVNKNWFSNFFTFLPHGRKASANMWWIIIGAVIALVVMIILMVMFTSKTGTLEGGLLDCESKGGDCTHSTVADCENVGGSVSSAFSCKDTAKECCFGSKKSQGKTCTSGIECISGTCGTDKKCT
ncbi:hypothetical protein HOL21_04405 [Candidatus Woesearchaeota archaeon]|jgi:hypothetical protein|nr:hypothetical protein [Candidatus Woesearchaeota archaeon]MBT5397429.1 hypothetical protein [Candidatus Woesearchaeota archaeon]MBT5924959.1 hypothetical protein [Candidatus Woesearchaeota archaeon]MBT6367063.1 hypothetical protein [Candidatus Woesearchaeota archaeon]MBT7762829.1 hypothetical protein [Candidatus Woesearchaeota archaeon]